MSEGPGALDRASGEVRIPATDGFALAANVDEPPEGMPLRGAIVIASATGVPRRLYAAFSSYLREAGFAVVRFDYRGIGGSRPESLRGFRATLAEWGSKDLAGVIDWMGARHPKVPLLLVGHSVGGQILGLTPKSDRLAAALFIAAQSGYWKRWAPRHRPRMLLLWYFLIPVVSRVIGYTPMGKITGGEDLPLGVALEWARWGRHPRYLRGYHGNAEGDDGTRYRDFRRPLHAIAFTDDELFAPRHAVEQLLTFYGKGPENVRSITPAEGGAKAIGHFGFFKDKFRETLWPQARDWLLGAAAQSADRRTSS